MRTLLAVFLALVLGSSCLARYAPARLSASTPLLLEVSGLQSTVEVLVDARGVPHVFGAQEADLAFGLGFMHGRERTFQVQVMKHAARGRLTELFGADALPLDQRLRLLSWRLDAGFAALSARDRATLEAYAAGINAGAANAGTTAEQALLGLSFGTFTAEDSFAIMRLQAWSLSADVRDELARHHLLAGLPQDDPRRALLDAPLTTGGVPIVVDPQAPRAETLEPHQPRAETARPPAFLDDLPEAAAALAQHLGLDQLGASNSWVVHGSKTAAGVPVLCNDPHLSHELPSVFYLAHLEAPDFTVAGVTFAGIPAVLIGHTRHLAWGMTVSYADAQDLVRLTLAKDSTEVALIDGERVPLERLEQRFRLGRSPDAEMHTETWYGSRFGPVMPPSWVKTNDRLALVWPAFDVGGVNAAPVSGFWDLARATNVDEATAAISRFQVSGQNVVLGFTDGTIAYRLAAYAPLRRAGETGRLPRAGATSQALPERLLAQDEKPALTNPPTGFIVAANQRVIGDEDWRVRAVGTSGVPPHRARRIHERLEALMSEGKPTADALLAVQQDITSTEARDLAPALAAACPTASTRHDAERVKAFCAALSSFDGVFSTDSLGALPYVATLTALRARVVQAMGVTDAAAVKTLARSFPVGGAVERALTADPASALFGGDLRTMLALAVDDALDDVVARTGKSPASWRWGAVHTLEFKGPLARVPLVGGFFASAKSEQPGHGNTVRAESGLPVDHGAAMRMVVELSNPPRARFTLDTGQSGAPKEPHAFDQFDAWNRGAPSAMPMRREDVERDAGGRVVLTPRR
ncbi:MAG: penicillin acylase family protein [Myxococcaceae bacterium]|nr:penicillin acylase family protein [Myxococcaceae bacterium]